MIHFICYGLISAILKKSGENCFKMIQFLCSQGADPNQKDKSGKNALIYGWFFCSSLNYEPCD